MKLIFLMLLWGIALIFSILLVGYSAITFFSASDLPDLMIAFFCFMGGMFFFALNEFIISALPERRNIDSGS